jgi:aconitate hydratase
VKAVVCETFERIHRSNLVGMGVLPLQFQNGMTRKTLNLSGHETFDVNGIEGGLRPAWTYRSPSIAATAPRKR